MEGRRKPGLRINRLLVGAREFDFDNMGLEGELPNLDSDLDWKVGEEGKSIRLSHNAYAEEYTGFF